ncbi:MAG: polysaccharide deacetylase family protein [Propionicimonas sp.]|nr:polysaccharide deacetylase family protein [Propionicimonas sp.]
MAWVFGGGARHRWKVLGAGLAVAGLMLSGCARVHPLTPSLTAPSRSPRPTSSLSTSPSPPPTAPPSVSTPSTTPPSTPATSPTTAPASPTKPPLKPDKPAKVNCAKLKCIAITFDDGPSAQSGEVLDLLKKEGVKATFFVIGENVKLHPAMVKRMAAEGHVVGNHSYTHPQFWHLSAAAITSEITRTSDAIEASTGKKVTLLRPPYGQSNSTVHGIERKLGLAQILWSVDSLDWKSRNTEKIIKLVNKEAKPGAIVLLHEIHPETRAAIPGVIKSLRKKGYTFVTVPQLLGKTKPGVNYSELLKSHSSK